MLEKNMCTKSIFPELLQVMLIPEVNFQNGCGSDSAGLSFYHPCQWTNRDKARKDDICDPR